MHMASSLSHSLDNCAAALPFVILAALFLTSCSDIKDRDVESRQTGLWRQKVEGILLEVAKDGTPVEPVQKPSNQPLISFEFDKSKILHLKGDYNYPYLGSFLNVVRAVPLEFKSIGESDFSIDAVRFVQKGGEVAYLVFTHDTGSRNLILFSQSGRELSSCNIDLSTRAVVSNQYVLTMEDEQFSLYKLHGGSLKLQGNFSTSDLKRSLYRDLDDDQNAFTFDTSAYQFEVNDSKLTVWCFYYNLNVMPTKASHLRIEGDLSRETGVLELKRSFGESTVAERMPLPRFYQSVLLVEDTMLVPRLFDPQIDVFNKGGDLERTIALKELQPVFPFYDYSSGQVLDQVILAYEQQTTFNFSDIPSTMGVFFSGGDLIVNRKIRHQALSFVTDLIKPNRKALTAYSMDLSVIGGGPDGFYSVIKGGSPQSSYKWQKSSEINLGELEKSDRYWLLISDM